MFGWELTCSVGNAYCGSMPDQTQYLTVAEVRQRFAERGISVSDETLRRWAKRGKVPAKRFVGRQYHFAVEDVDALLADASAA